MAVKEKATKEEIEQLKGWIEQNNYTIYTILRHVSRSGMYREIGIVIPVCDDHRKVRLYHPNYLVARVLGWTEKTKTDGIAVSGCGMDMGFHMIYTLSQILYGDGYRIRQEWI